MTAPRQPTAEECSTNADILDDNGTVLGRACWYPQMDGYHGKAVATVDLDGHVDVHVWHDGEFPFDGHCHACSVPRPPVVLHHCDPDQFVRFGQFLGRISEEAERG